MSCGLSSIELIMNAASQSWRMPPRANEAAMGMVPYMQSGEATPSALATIAPKPPILRPRSAANARWMASFANTDTAEPISMPSTHQPKICSSCTVK